MTTTGPRTSVGIRRANRADLLEVYEIERESFPQPWPYAAFEQFLESSGFLVAVEGDAVDEETVVGYVVADTVTGHGGTIGHVKDLAVRPDRRGEGIGRTLLTRALSRLAAQGVDTVKLEVRESNRAARSLYEEFGFDLHHVVPAYYDDGEDAFVLVKDE